MRAHVSRSVPDAVMRTHTITNYQQIAVTKDHPIKLIETITKILMAMKDSCNSITIKEVVVVNFIVDAVLNIAKEDCFIKIVMVGVLAVLVTL